MVKKNKSKKRIDASPKLHQEESQVVPPGETAAFEERCSSLESIPTTASLPPDAVEVSAAASVYNEPNVITAADIGVVQSEPASKHQNKDLSTGEDQDGNDNDAVSVLQALQMIDEHDDLNGTPQSNGQKSVLNGTDSLHDSSKMNDIVESHPLANQSIAVSKAEDTKDEMLNLRRALEDSKLANEVDRASIEELREQLARVQDEKTHIEAQYRSLFGKVTQMKTTLGARLKQDAEEIGQNRATIEDLEAQNSVLNETVNHMQEKMITSTDTISSLTQEKIALEGESTRFKQVIDEMNVSLSSERALRTAAEERNMMTAAEWENLAVEERSARDSLRDRIHDLEEQLAAQNNAYDNLRNIIDQDNMSITKLKQQLYELQDSHAKELHQGSSTLQERIDGLEEELRSSEARIDLLRTHTSTLESDLEKIRPYEQEVREKNLLIGKLRHEAVILNEHLTKALRLLKRGSSNDSVDRQLLNNLLLSFFQLPRQDSKRFEVLKILASVLAWDDMQKEQAGLLRPGSAIAPLAPMSPMSFRSPPSSPNLSRGGMSRRSSGTIQLQAADFMGPNRESMSDLWINFLQSEAAMNAADAMDSAS